MGIRFSTSKVDKLHKACKEGNVEKVKKLLERGVNINEVESDRNASFGNYLTRPLMVAVCHNHTELVRFLLQRGADVNRSMDDRVPVIFYACHRNCPIEILELLINHGAHVNVVVNSTASPLYQAVMTGTSKRVEMLCKAGADLEDRTYDKTPLMHALLNEKLIYDVDTFRVLVECGADVHAKCYYFGANLLLMYIDRWPIVIDYARIDFLIAKGVDVNHKSRKGKFPLFAACEHGYENIADRLIEAGADVNMGFGDGTETSLHAACSNGHYDCAKLLLDAGADPFVVFKGKRPRDVAKEKGHRAIYELLPRSPKQPFFSKDNNDHEVEPGQELLQCSICFTNRVSTLFLPCRHLKTCNSCSNRLQTCPHCNQKIQDKITKIFL